MLGQKFWIYVCWALLGIFLSCWRNEKLTLTGNTWGEKLGFPKDKKVLILHADDMGMCSEANQAGMELLANKEIQSAAVMVPCPAADEFIEWYVKNPAQDIGVHTTLTSEWKEYRWGPVSQASEVPGLIDADGYLWHDVPDVVQHATAAEVEKEIRAQIEKVIAAGIRPSHLDTHMGTVYGCLGFTQVYMKLAMEYNIPAMVIEFTDDVLQRYRGEGYPITEELLNFASTYTLPKLDDFWAAPNGKTYEEKKQNFFNLVRSLKPGIIEIIFHPSVETDKLKSITHSWQQRVWEKQLFSDPEVKQFFKDEGILFTNWKEMLKRFAERI